MKGPLVVKYGGAALALACHGERGSSACHPERRREAPESKDEGPPSDPVLAEIAELWRAGTQIVLVHGGGPEIDRALEARGIATERIAGQRVTDAATLEVAEAVLCGTINKRLVRAFLALGIPAAGISGEDASLLVADRLHSSGASLGFVGDVIACNPQLLEALLRSRILPVVAPLAVARDALHAYNVNADLAAAAIASGVKAEAFVLVTNVARVLRDPDDPASGIDRMTPEEARAFAATDACRSSMKPKVIAAANAAQAGVEAAYISGAGPGAIAAARGGDATVISERA